MLRTSWKPLLWAGAAGLLATWPSDAQSVERQPSEPLPAFVERATRFKVADDGLGHAQVAETTQLLKGQTLLIAFTLRPSDEADHDINNFDVHVSVFVKKSDRTYEPIETAIACEVEGGRADVKSFFFTPLKGELTPVLGAICRWPEHPAADCHGPDEVRLFRVTPQDVAPIQMQKLTSLLYTERKPEPKADYQCTYALFKTAKDVKSLLNR